MVGTTSRGCGMGDGMKAEGGRGKRKKLVRWGRRRERE